MLNWLGSNPPPIISASVGGYFTKELASQLLFCLFGTSAEGHIGWFSPPVLRIRDVYPGSRIRLFSIPDPGSELSPSRIPDPHQRIHVFKPQKKQKYWFLSSKKYDPGCSSRIPDPGSGCWLSPIPDPGSRGQKGTQSRIPDPDPQHCSPPV